MNFLKSKNYPLILNFLISFSVALLVRPQNFAFVLDGELINPDSYMRLVRIQEALGSGQWFTDIVSRNESGMGTLIYWSHFLDAFILLLRLPLMCFMPAEQALFWAGALLGPILLGLLGMACTWVLLPWVKGPWRVLIAVAIAISVPITNYGQIGVATHHLLIVIFVVLTWGLVARTYIEQRAFYGLAAGVSSGLAIWVSPEATPYCLMGFGGLLIPAMFTLSPARAQLSSSMTSIATYGIGFLATILIAILLDPPHQGIFSPALDRVSVTFLTLSFLLLLVSLMPYLLMRLHGSSMQRMIWLPLALIVALAIWLALFPAYLKGLNGLMSPEEAAAFFITTEMSPINTFELFMYFGFSGVLSVLAIFVMGLSQRTPVMKLAFLYLGLCALICSVFAFWHVRFAIYSAAISVMVLGVLLSRFSDDSLGPQNQIRRALVIFGFLLLPSLLNYSISLVGSAQQFTREAGQSLPQPHHQSVCPLSDAVSLIAPLGNTVVLTDANIGPALLYKTQAKIVGSFYHAGIKGYMRQQLAWGATDLGHVPAELIATGANYILFCPASNPTFEPRNQPNSLFELLNSASPPTWLSLVSPSKQSAWVLYQISGDQ